MTATV